MIEPTTIISGLSVIGIAAASIQMVRDRRKLRSRRLTSQDVVEIARTLRSDYVEFISSAKTTAELESKIRELEVEVVRLRTIIETFSLQRRGDDNLPSK